MLNVKLVPFRKQFITEEYISWLNNKELLKYSRQQRLDHSKSSCEDYLKSFEKSSNRFWSVQDSEGEQVGTVTAFVDPLSLVADIGIMIGRCGKGFGTAAWGEAIHYLFEELGMRKITAGTLAEHHGMISIFLRWGMVQEGLLREQEFLNGKVYDVVKYGLLKNDWLTLNAKEAKAHDNNNSRC